MANRIEDGPTPASPARPPLLRGANSPSGHEAVPGPSGNGTLGAYPNGGEGAPPVLGGEPGQRTSLGVGPVGAAGSMVTARSGERGVDDAQVDAHLLLSRSDSPAVSASKVGRCVPRSWGVNFRRVSQQDLNIDLWSRWTRIHSWNDPIHLLCRRPKLTDVYRNPGLSTLE